MTSPGRSAFGPELPGSRCVLPAGPTAPWLTGSEPVGYSPFTHLQKLTSENAQIPKEFNHHPLGIV